MNYLRACFYIGLVAAAPASAAGDISKKTNAPAVRGLDPANLDPSCAPCDNFYRYANGGWLDRNPIPESKARWSSYDEVDQRTRAELRSILEASAAAYAAGDISTSKGKLGLLYTTCLDTGRAAAGGVAPIRPELDRIAAISSRASLQNEITRLQLRGRDTLFVLRPTTDPQNSMMTIGAITPAGLTLPDVTHYYSEEPTSREARERLRSYIIRVLELAGMSLEAAAADAERIISIETELANNSLTSTERRDLARVTNRMRRAELAALTPNWNWDTYLTKVGASGADLINVREPQQLRTADRLLAERTIEDWRAYLRWRALSASAQWLSPEFAEARAAFISFFSGVTAQEPRWEQCMGEANARMTDALGREYVARVFTPQVRARGLEMTANLKAALRERLAGLEWMSDATRKEAVAKLDAMQYALGGPSEWTDYSQLKLEHESFPEQLAASAEFQYRQENARIGRAMDPERWDFPAQRASGAFNFGRNRLVYPAAKFQPPFFDPDADDAVNYGAIGATIAHEIGHGFDDQGRRFDAAGNMRDWWTAEDARRYTERADKLAKQFDEYIVNGDKVNGRLALGENLADLGGLTISYYALQKALKGKKRAKIDGFTPEQRFFLSWAQNWRSKTRPEQMRIQVKVGPHAPAHLRVLGPLSNMPEFAEAFNCRLGDEMVRSPEDRVKLF